MTDISAEIKEIDRSLAEARARIAADEARRAELLRQAGEEYARRLTSVLTREMVDLLAPTHSRAGCDDVTIRNGFVSIYANERELPRCRRCALLEAVDTKFWPGDVRLSVEIVPA